MYQIAVCLLSTCFIPLNEYIIYVYHSEILQRADGLYSGPPPTDAGRSLVFSQCFYMTCDLLSQQGSTGLCRTLDKLRVRSRTLVALVLDSFEFTLESGHSYSESISSEVSS